MSRLCGMLAMLILAVGALGRVCCQVSATRPEPDETRSIDELLAGLRSNDSSAAQAAEAELGRRADLLTGRLADALAAPPAAAARNPEDLFQRTAPERAYSVLRRLRAKPAHRQLLINICYFQPTARTESSLTSGYPYATLLAQLGPTAAYEIVGYLANPPMKADLSDRAIDLFANVFLTVFSPHGEVEEAKSMLQRARRRFPQKEHIVRLEKRFKELIEGPKPPPPVRPEAALNQPIPKLPLGLGDERIVSGITSDDLEGRGQSIEGDTQ